MWILFSLMLLMARSDANTCQRQSKCLHVDVQLQNGDTTNTYEICLSWTSQNRFHDSCVSMLSNWMTDGDKQCQTVVGCDKEVSFAVPNGEADCVTSATENAGFMIDNEYAICNACKWTISAPLCSAFHAQEAVSNEETQGLMVLDNDGNVRSSMFIASASIFACVLLNTLCVFICCSVMECRDEPIVKNDATDVYLNVEQSIDEHQKEDEAVTVAMDTETTT
eukprot:184708_1